MEYKVPPIFHLFAEGHSTLPNHFFLSFSEDRREYNKIKHSKFECEGFGLDRRRNFQKEGGWVLKYITSGIACHIIFWVFHKDEFPSAFDMFLMESLDDIGV